MICYEDTAIPPEVIRQVSDPPMKACKINVKCLCSRMMWQLFVVCKYLGAVLGHKPAM